MGDLTKNISRYEIACHCGCGFDSLDFETITVVQEICDHFAETLGLDRVILHIHSAARCFSYNRIPVKDGGPGSNDQSQHPLARAIDFHIKDVSPDVVYSYLCQKYPDRYGIGSYESFTHLDTRSGGSARWKS